MAFIYAFRGKEETPGRCDDRVERHFRGKSKNIKRIKVMELVFHRSERITPEDCNRHTMINSANSYIAVDVEVAQPAGLTSRLQDLRLPRKAPVKKGIFMTTKQHYLKYILIINNKNTKQTITHTQQAFIFLLRWLLFIVYIARQRLKGEREILQHLLTFHRHSI